MLHYLQCNFVDYGEKDLGLLCDNSCVIVYSAYKTIWACVSGYDNTAKKCK